MSNIFVALQCFHCSTMQVKQTKKSSNKWVCVVCNQRQSVQRIYARGPLAKDVRNFTQAFNMSRMTPGLSSPRSVGALVGSEVEDRSAAVRGSPSSEIGVGGGSRSKRRTDWTEYLDPQQDGEEEDDEDRGGKTGASKKCRTAMEDRGSSKKCRRTAMEERKSSRWSEYLKEDEEETNEEEDGSSPNCANGDWSEKSSQLSEFKVEEEVHPDFQ